MLIERLERRALREPGGIVLRSQSDGIALTHAALWSAACRRANAFRDAGLAAGDVILLFAPQGADTVVTWLGAMLAGGVPSLMPLPSDRQDAAQFWAQHEALFRHLGGGVVVTPSEAQPGLRAIAGDLPIRLLPLEELRALDREGPPPARRAPDDIALLQHSSGTTGLKKGVALSFAQLDAQLAAYTPRLGLEAGDRIVSWLPLYHDMGLIACLVLPLSLGIETVLLDPFRWVARPQILLDAVEQHRGTHVWLPNFAFLHLVRAVRAGARRWDLSSVKAFVNCSEPCKPHAFDAFLDRWAAHGVRPEAMTCCYAMAEAVFAVTQTVPGGMARRARLAAEGFGELGAAARLAAAGEPAAELLSSGPPLPGVGLRLTDGAGAEVPPGQYGEIHVAAPFLFEGYHLEPARTARVLRDGWYRTGDVGVLLDGELHVCGRLDDMIIVNGRNLYAHEVERVAAAVPGVTAGRVVAFPSFVEEIGSNQLVVVAESELAEEPERLALAAMIGRQVMTAVGVQPADVRVVPRRTVLKTTSGKVDRVSNMRRYAEGRLVTWGATATVAE